MGAFLKCIVPFVAKRTRKIKEIFFKERNMSVFISHSTLDDKIAQKVYKRLTDIHGIKCWIDDIDPELEHSRNSTKITSLIMERLEECTNILAVVSNNTKSSWWVPFEIGVARKSPRVITTFTDISDWNLPKYLHEWPILRGESAIETFAYYYKREKQIIKEATEGSDKEGHFILESERIKRINVFHDKLKSVLNQ
jgi:hypothetical protein